MKILKIYTSNPVRQVVSVSKTTEARMIKPFSDILGDTVDISKISGTPSEILERITGEFSKEDLLRAEKIKQQYADSTSVKEEHSELCARFFPDMISQICQGEEITENQRLISYNPACVTKAIQQNMKEYVIKLFALKSLMYKNTSRIAAVPYSEWFDTNLGVQNKSINSKHFVHPCDKILKIVGDYNSEELDNISKLEKQFNSKNINEIWNEKFLILNKIYKIFEKTNPDFMGSFSEKEIKKLKLLAAKYTALNKCQTKHGYFSRDLETLLFSKHEDFVPNNYISGLGLVTDKVVVNDKPAVIIFSDNYKRHSFKLYDIYEYAKFEDFIKNIPENISLEELNSLNTEAKTLISQEKNALISEINFEVMDKEKIQKAIKVDDSLTEEINKVIENNDLIYFISSYQNYKKKEYPSGAKLLGIKLLKFLKEKDGYPLFLRAQAYSESNHSPVSLYLRAGFKPISKTEQEVKNIMNNNHSEYINEPLYMYAQNFDEIGKKIEILSRVFFP